MREAAMRSIYGYAILEEGTMSGSRYWVTMGGPNSMTMIAASSGRRPSKLYADRAAAEHDAAILRLRNVRDVERSRWRGSYSTEPATYTVVELGSWVEAEWTGDAVAAGAR
jgi:hypothetical protein